MLEIHEYAARGPHPVGVATVVLPDAEKPGREVPVDVWYPAEPTAFESAEPAQHPIGAGHEARKDAVAAVPAEPRPLVAFSHGNSGFSRQSTFLTTHLASWGMIVTAPDHTGNTFFEMMGVEDEDERIRRHKAARSDRPRDLSAAIGAVLAGGAWPAASPDRIGVAGHSFGGWTALKMPGLDPRVRAVCGLAPASEAFVGKKAFAPGELPFANEIPALIVSALDDVLVDVDASVRPLHQRLGDPSGLVGVRDADHFHFCDHLELIHGLHEKNGKRPKQTRETRPYSDLLPEDRVHRLLRGLITYFFAHALEGESTRLADVSAAVLSRLDPNLEQLDAEIAARAATR